MVVSTAERSSAGTYLLGLWAPMPGEKHATSNASVGWLLSGLVDWLGSFQILSMVCVSTRAFSSINAKQATLEVGCFSTLLHSLSPTARGTES